jgi:DNA polymerase elongation subunit (family B)
MPALPHVILSAGKPKPEVVEAVHERLRQVAGQLRGGQLPLGSFIITKQLTKRPEDYPDARAQPHVQVSRCCCGVGQKVWDCLAAAGYISSTAQHCTVTRALPLLAGTGSKYTA